MDGLKVKPGKEYVLGGKVYLAGETVNGVPDKFVPILTSAKGPLSHGGAAAPKPVDLPSAAFRPATDMSLAELRQRYMETVGKRPFGGWDADTLNQKIASYNRRDMRAED